MPRHIYSIPAIVETPLREITEQRRVAQIASGPALAAAVRVGLRLPAA